MAVVDHCTTGKPGTVMTVDAARLRTLAAVSPLRETETLALEPALGRIAATGAKALVNLPPFDNAAMDGYALRTADLIGPGPWNLPVAGRVAAGDPGNQKLAPGTATGDSRDAIGRPILRRLGHGASASLSPLAMAKGIAALPALPANLPRVNRGTPLMVDPL